MAEIKEVTPKEVESRLEKEEDVEVIDVREDEEVAQGMIGNARHIPLGELPDELESLDKKKEYVMVCRSGGRSMKAAQLMDEQGFNVSNMAGGMLKWDGEVIS